MADIPDWTTAHISIDHEHISGCHHCDKGLKEDWLWNSLFVQEDTDIGVTVVSGRSNGVECRIVPSCSLVISGSPAAVSETDIEARRATPK
jgi:hypothetical protein